ncbi:MAG: alpha/beta hydrolase [Defluviimonas sp.]|uniref:alpha/beta hydrolase n=1 Tax=Albidovulum sp. TaxID=1872424 RepID=UPI001E139817|nr:alpha/beta hydrolase [Paracoccaceae bacterium]MCC0063761.1 alpha/beta hydrolase [Defluviimonas sp.]
MTDQADYAKLIDDEIWAFIRKTEASYPADTVTATIARQREIYDTMCADFETPRPAGLAVTDRQFGGVRARLYEPATAKVTVVYLHGGGFVVGGLHSHDGVCADLAQATGYRVVAADYRLAPEHRHPAAFDDTLAAIRAVGERFGGPIVLAGDSAGGNLAAAAAHALRGSALEIRGIVLIYPGLGFDRIGGSMARHAHAPMLTAADIDFYREIRAPEGVSLADDPTANPLADDDFTGLPPAFVSAAECDPLADDGPAYVARILAAGGSAQAIVEPGLVHGWLRARRMSARAEAAFARIVAATQALGRGDWTPG